EICGVPTRSSTGVCHRTPDCKRETDRRKNQNLTYEQKQRHREWQKRNPDRVKQYQLRLNQRRRKDPEWQEKTSERQRTRRKANPEKFRKIEQAYRQANPEKARQYQREYLQLPDRPCRYHRTAGCTEFAAIGRTA